VPVWGAAILVGTAYGAGWLPSLPAKQAIYQASDIQPVQARFGSCHVGGGTNCVVDGDTFYIGGEKVRIAGIDAPETHPSRCEEEDRLGRAATKRLRQLLNSGPVTTTSIDRDEDSYGRKLRNVQVNGSDVGETLVNEGLARWYGGGKQPWC
jgi:endonuclease YncB( thermonuclease family)